MLTFAIVALIMSFVVTLLTDKTDRAYVISLGVMGAAMIVLTVCVFFIEAEPEKTSAYTVDSSADFGENSGCILVAGYDCLIRTSEDDYVVVPVNLLGIEYGGDSFTLTITELTPHEATFWLFALDEPRMSNATLFVPEDCKEYLPDKLLNP